MLSENMSGLHPLPKPYKTGKLFGISFVKELLHPSVKSLVDTMQGLRGSYIGMADKQAHLYIDGNPIIKIDQKYINVIKELLADDVKTYHDITEYRLSPERFKEISIYYV